MSRHRTVTGQLGLPKNWKWVSLGEILSNIIGGGTPSKSNPSYWQGKIPWLTIKDMRTRRPIDSIDHISEAAVKESATNIIPADTVIIATRVGLGKVIRVPYDATINQDLKALIPKDVIDKSYLEYWIVSIADYLESIGSGTTVKGIRLETLKEIPFPLAPPEDQKRIVAELEKQFSRLDEAVASLKRIQANLKRYKAAVLKAAVEGKLTEQWRKDHPDVEPADQLLKRILVERRAKWEADEQAKMKAKGGKPKDDSWKKKYKEPAGPDTTNLPELPEGWVWASLESVSDALGGYAFESRKFSSSGHQIIKMANIKMGKIDLSKKPSFISDIDESVIEKYLLNDDDILVTLTGTRNKRDYGYVVTMRNPLNLLLNQRIARIRPSINILSKYLEIAMQSESYQNRFFSYETGNVGQGNVGMGAVTKESIALPTFNEQRTIVEEIDRRLSVTEELEITIGTNLKRSERLRQTILQQAFSGELLS